MKQEDEVILKVTKEIVIKYIEIGRLALTSFDEVFKNIHTTVYESFLETKNKNKDNTKK